MKSKRFEILINPAQQAALQEAMKKGKHETTAALLTEAVRLYLSNTYGIDYPPTRAKGGNQRKATREWTKHSPTLYTCAVNGVGYVLDKYGKYDWRIFRAVIVHGGDNDPIMSGSDLRTVKAGFEEWLAQQS